MRVSVTIILTILLIGTSLITSAQKYETRMRGCVTDNGIELRWAPVTPDTWRIGMTHGYILERFTIMKDSEILSPEEISKEHKVISGAFKPVPMEDWEPYAEDKYMAIAAECIYGEEEKTSVMSPQMVYELNLRRQQRFSFALFTADMSTMVAQMSGLAYSDKQVIRGEKYLYKVYVNDTIPQDTAMVYLDASVPSPLFRIPKPEVRWSNRFAEVKIDLSLLEGAFTSYIVERSEDNGKTFTSLSDVPSLSIDPAEDISRSIFIPDSLKDNDTKYIYRVYGIDCFGRRSEPAETDEGHGVMPLTGFPHITRCEVEDNNRVAIDWVFPDSLNLSTMGFRVYKQSGPKSRLKMIYEGNDSKERHFVDRLPGMTNYYKVSVYNHETENLMPLVSYAALVDSFPPMAPMGLEGVIDTTGLATIRWHSNNESDLAGYRVYTANRETDTYSLLTPDMMTDTVFSYNVSLNTLTHEIFFRVRAVDKRDNHSAPSQSIMLMRPDTIAPVAPVMKSALTHRGKASLQWVCSSSDDVIRHYILRKQTHADKYDTIAVMIDKQTSFDDKSASEGLNYIYAIFAEDSSGNISEMSSIYYRAEEQTADRVKVKCRQSAEGNNLTWSVESKHQIVEYIVSKSEDDAPLVPVTRTTKKEYTDTDIKLGHKYSYAIQLVFDDGTESGFYK